MHNFIKNRLKQRGAALVEYAVLLSFVCAVGWSFVGSNNGMTGSIGSIIHSVERLLGMNGVVNVDKNNWINDKKFNVAITKIGEIGKMVGGLVKYYAQNNKE